MLDIRSYRSVVGVFHAFVSLAVAQHSAKSSVGNSWVRSPDVAVGLSGQRGGGLHSAGNAMDGDRLSLQKHRTANSIMAPSNVV